MTAEIAILNRSAVALAADSAMTVGYEEEQKIYHTHKLFMLSRTNPVGVMVFNSASILSVPWETIIKQYRKDIGTLTFDHLNDYAEHLLSYLEDNSFFFPEQVQDNQAIRDILSTLMFLSDRIDETIEERTQSSKKVSLVAINMIIKAWIDSSHESLSKLTLPPTYPSDHKRRTYARYIASIELLIDEVFQYLPLTAELRKKLRRISLYSLLASNNIIRDNYTGIVVAGFGDKDLYPALTGIRVDSVVLGKMKYLVMKKRQVVVDDDALIYAFAQSDVVEGFIDGITPDLKDGIKEAMAKQLSHLGDSILKTLPRMTAKKKREVVDEIEKVKGDILSTFSSELEAHCDENYSDPVVDTVAVLPKEELAMMAETLVNLTAFKRRVTLEAETVGGPIDVAVITKGDGFIWIKRKHYFDAKLNPQFFKSHY